MNSLNCIVKKIILTIKEKTLTIETMITKNNYYIKMAKLAAERGTCSKMKVGAVLVKNDSVISTGYNGAERGAFHCLPVDHDGKCTNAVHAEMNAIIQAAKNGQSVKDSVMYITHSPCRYCSKCLINAGIRKVFFDIPHKVAENEILLLQLNAEKVGI